MQSLTGAVRHTSRTLAIVVLACLVGCGPTVSNRGADGADGANVHGGASEYWEVHYLQGAKVGYGHTSIRPLADGDDELLEIETEMQLSISRAGQASEQQVRLTSIETPEGELRRFEMKIAQGPTPITSKGEVSGNRLMLTTGPPNRPQESTIDWSSEIKSTSTVERSVEQQPMKPGERRAFKVFDPTLQQVAEIELTAGHHQPVTLLDGEQSLLRIDQVMRLANESRIESVMWTDGQGRVLKISLPAMQQETFRTTQEVAEAASTGAKLDLTDDLIVRIDRPIVRPHATRLVRYRVELVDGNPAKVFPSSPGQRVKSTGKHTAEITVRSLRPQTAMGDEQAGDKDLTPNSYIQCDDAAVVEMAKAAAGDLVDPWEVAVALEKHVRQTMTKVDFSQALATAADVVLSHQGDCTEHSVLLAALARARGIPARTAMGLVYVEAKQGFGFHMWTEVLIRGQWISLDATLGRGGIGAAHLKLGDTNFSDGSAFSSFLPVTQVMFQLKIEVLDREQ